MAKKEKVIDFTKPEKITDEELVKLQSTIRTIDRLTADVGRVEVQKYAALVAMQKVQANVEEIRTEFVNKYGTDNVNIQTGEIAYAPEKEEENVKADS
tara:strand:+ start:803 stop:1096 length:294 start_codon:yes stop_codon:yes gene_type:complete